METGKNSQTNIVRAYQRYLKLQRGYSANTLDAYRRDLEKLLHYLEQTGRDVLDVQLSDLQHFAAGVFCNSTVIATMTPQNFWNLPFWANICLRC